MDPLAIELFRVYFIQNYFWKKTSDKKLKFFGV